MMLVVICEMQFGHLFRGARVIFFIDNEGVKEAFVSGTTKSVEPCWCHDAPSRLKWSELAEMIESDIVQVELGYKLSGRYTDSRRE